MTATQRMMNAEVRMMKPRKRAIQPSAFSLQPSARRYLVGGVNSPVRACHQVGGTPLLLVRANGAEVVDADGIKRVDFIMGWGALLLGHHPPVVAAALRRALRQGWLPGLTHPLEAELARRIAEAVPSVEQVRFTASGTEACMTAVRVARAATGRTKILVFDGCYHGHSDSLLARRSAGIPEAVERETISVPFNDAPALEDAMDGHGSDLACVIVEPVAANMGVVPPEPGWLSRIRALTSRSGALLIFDEVVTGFRFGPGGAQRQFGVSPDLTVFGKVIGGGLPIGALGGPRYLMEHLAPTGQAYHGGTFAGHPLSMAAGIATLDALRAHPPYERLEQLTTRWVEGLRDAAKAAGVPAQINRAASMCTVFFTETPVRNLAQAGASHRGRFARWANALRAEGIVVPPSPFEAMFLSAVHTGTQVDRMVRSARAALRQAARP